MSDEASGSSVGLAPRTRKYSLSFDLASPSRKGGSLDRDGDFTLKPEIAGPSPHCVVVCVHVCARSASLRRLRITVGAVWAPSGNLERF